MEANTEIYNIYFDKGQSKKNDSGLSKEMVEKLANSVETFMNRPI